MSLPDIDSAWGRDEIVMAYWEHARSHAFFRWGGAFRTGGLDNADLESATSLALVEAAGRWGDFAASHDTDPTSKPQFWGFLRQHIEWEALRALKTRRWPVSLDETGADEETPSRELIVASLNRYRAMSLLHRDAVDFITTLPTKWTAALALRFFEEMSLVEAGEILDTSLSMVSNRVKSASQRVRDFVLSEVMDDPPTERETIDTKPWEIPQSFHDWAWQHYGTDVHSYLGYVIRHYRSDVSYLVDILDKAHGKYSKPGLRGPQEPRKLTREQVAEICRRVDAGETKVSVANAFGVSDYAIAHHYKRRNDRPSAA